MPKPVTLPIWATTAGPSDLTEPLLAEKQAGWPVGYEPPSQWFNWWMLLVYNWVVWLDAFESTAHTWTALQQFSLGISAYGADVNFLTGDTGKTVYVLGAANFFFCEGTAEFTGPTTTDVLVVGGSAQFDLDSTFTGPAQFNGTAGFADAATFGGPAEFTATVAVNTTSEFNDQVVIAKDHATNPSVSVTNTTGGPAGKFVSAAGTPALDVDGFIDMAGASATNYAVSGHKNTLTKDNFCKAWCVVQLNGAAAPTLVDAFNIESVSRSGNFFSCFFSTLVTTGWMTTVAGYVTHVTPLLGLVGGNALKVVQVDSCLIASAVFSVWVADAAALMTQMTGTDANLNFRVMLSVHGRQS